MKRYYADYRTWEDYNAGMWNVEVKVENIQSAKTLLCNPKQLLLAMHRVCKEWSVSSKHNLSNLNSNRRSWLGQAACCLLSNCTEYETRLAWKELTKETQSEANGIADLVIAEWEFINKYNKNDYIKEDFTL